MKSNRKTYQGTGIVQEFTTREQASAFAQTQSLQHFRIERRYAPQSPSRSEDGYVCVIRVQEQPFSPLNDQREYLDKGLRGIRGAP